MALAVQSLRAQIARWLDRQHLGCRTERSEWNRLVRRYYGSRTKLPRPNGARAGFPSIAVQISPRRGRALAGQNPSLDMQRSGRLQDRSLQRQLWRSDL